jgi:hypothetical protein
MSRLVERYTLARLNLTQFCARPHRPGFGGPWRYTYCIAENEAESPWASCARARGFGPDDNVVSAIPLEGPALVWDHASDTPERLVIAIADMMSAIGGCNIYRQAMALVPSPQHAEVFAKARLSRDAVHALLIERAGRKLGEISATTVPHEQVADQGVPTRAHAEARMSRSESSDSRLLPMR